jgi:hypothetical protein
LHDSGHTDRDVRCGSRRPRGILETTNCTRPRQCLLTILLMNPGVAGILQTEYSRAMPLQNRVTPFSRIEAVPQRGLFTGNRGVLHDDQRRLLTERWRHRNWIICDLQYKDWRRTLMTPRRWTELFFLDESVALAAGHRPCAFCRREAFRRFAAAWGSATGSMPKAPEIDRQLHDGRVPPMRGSPRHSRPLSALPAGSMVLLAENPAQPYLVSVGQLLPRLLPMDTRGLRRADLHTGPGRSTADSALDRSGAGTWIQTRPAPERGLVLPHHPRRHRPLVLHHRGLQWIE